MDLDSRQRTHIARRKRRLLRWPWAVGSALVALLVLVAWLFVRHPLLVDPTELPRQMQDGSMATSTLSLMAGLLPVAVNLCLLGVAVTLLFAAIAFHRERRHIAIIDALQQRAGTG